MAAEGQGDSDGPGHDSTDPTPSSGGRVRVVDEMQQHDQAQPLTRRGEHPSGRAPKAIKRYKRPRPAFQKTEGYSDTLSAMKSGDSVIHVHGMSGNGKSEIVRAVCQELDSEDGRLIWHVQGSETDFLHKELAKFVEELRNCGHISEERTNAVLEGLDDENVREFVNMTKGLQSPVLLVVEDISSETDKELMRNLIQASAAYDAISTPDAAVNLFQILVATRKANAIFAEQDLSELMTYRVVKINGFTEIEAIQFLLSSNSHVDEENVSDLAKMLAYSPLRLTLTRRYCKTYRTSFKSYYESLGRDKTIVAKEKELLESHPYLGKNHGYEVIMRAVRPKERKREEGEERNEEELQFSVIQMMSFIGHDLIPDFLIGRFFQQHKSMEISAEGQNVTYLLSRLETDCDLVIHEIMGADVPKAKYGEERSSIHQDILDCVRLDMDDNTKRKVLVDVLHAMVRVVEKDNRVHQTSDILWTLMKHMERVASFASEMLRTGFCIETPRQFDFETQICLSWLYDVLGFSMSTYSETKDQIFDRALGYLWSIACSYSDGKPFCLQKRLRNDLLDYKLGKHPDKTAEEAYERVKKASEKIPEKFIKDHYAKFSPLSKYLIDGMKKKLGDKIDWEEIDSEFEKSRSLTPDQVTTLRENRMLLTPKELRKVFLSERIASVLHTRGRQVLQLKNDISSEEQKRYEWYTELGLQLTKVMGNDTGIKTTFEYIIEANNKLPRMLHTRENESDDEFIERLKTAKEIAKRLKTAEGVYFEHGAFKDMSGMPYSVLNAMKYVVKANTKMHKRPHLFENRHNCPTNPDQDLKDCDELYDLAKQNAHFVMAYACIVHAGKYYAAIKQIEKALEVFEVSFVHNGQGINLQLQKRPNLYAWAVYNIARAMNEGGSNIPNGDSYRKSLLRRYYLVVDEKISKTWKDLLQKYILNK